MFIAALFINLLIILHLFNLKAEMHVDEIWSYAHSNANHSYLVSENYYKNKLYTGKKFLLAKALPDKDEQVLYENQWVNPDIFNDYIQVNSERRFDYDNVINQMEKVVDHTPLYFILLHTICSFFPDTFSMWYAESINIVSFVIAYIMLFKLAQMIFKDKVAALLCVILWGFSYTTLHTADFLRMYMLAEAILIAQIYVTMQILQKEKAGYKQWSLLLLLCILGYLTHYECLFFSFFFTGIGCLILLKQKKYKLMFFYAMAMLLSVFIFFAIYPYAITAIFGSNRNMEVNGLVNILFLQNYFRIFMLTTACAQRIITSYFNEFLQLPYLKVSYYVALFIGAEIFLSFAGQKNNYIMHWLFGSCFLFMIVMTFLFPDMGGYNFRYFAIITPLYAILTINFGHKLFNILNLKQKLRYWIAAILIVINTALSFIFFPDLWYFAPQGSREKFANANKERLFVLNAYRYDIVHGLIYYMKDIEHVYLASDVCSKQLLAELEKYPASSVLVYGQDWERIKPDESIFEKCPEVLQKLQFINLAPLELRLYDYYTVKN